MPPVYGWSGRSDLGLSVPTRLITARRMPLATLVQAASRSLQVVTGLRFGAGLRPARRRAARRREAQPGSCGSDKTWEHFGGRNASAGTRAAALCEVDRGVARTNDPQCRRQHTTVCTREVDLFSISTLRVLHHKRRAMPVSHAHSAGRELPRRTRGLPAPRPHRR